jgi:hypothetical protein
MNRPGITRFNTGRGIGIPGRTKDIFEVVSESYRLLLTGGCDHPLVALWRKYINAERD